jgi:hypothetical protein
MIHNPLIVVVADGRWDTYGAKNLRNRFKNRLLMQMGGVSATVEPGVYVFDVRPNLRGKLIVSLLPAK